MSEFIKGRTVFKTDHLVCLVKALGDVEPRWTDRIEIHEKAVSLFGYHGDRRAEVANVIIRREFIGGSSNDIGFVSKQDGTVEAIISAFDRRQGRDEEWMNKLAMHYAYRVAEKQAAKMGATINKTVNADGTWRVVLRKPEVKAWQHAGRAW